MKKLFLLSMLLLFPVLPFAQNSWVKWWPHPETEAVWPNNIIKTHDGGYALHWTAQYITPPNYIEVFTHLLKTDSLGNMQWDTWGDEFNHTINQMPDSSYIWGGRYITKLTKEGQFDWWIDLDTLIAPGAEIYTSVMTPDSHLVYIAYDEELGGDFFWWVFKMGLDGKLIWKEKHAIYYFPIQVQLLGNFKFIAIGFRNNYELFIFKFSETGVLVDSIQTNNSNVSYFNGFLMNAEGNLIVYGTGPSQFACIDTFGNVLWHKHILFPDTSVVTDGVVSTVENSDSSLVMISWGIGTNHINAILKTDRMGSLMWWNELPGIPSDGEIFSQSILSIVNKDGYVSGLRKGSRTIGIVKTDTNGFITKINCADKPLIIQKITLYQNYPNPFNSRTTISFRLPSINLVEVAIFNILGEKVERLIKERMAPGHHKIQWNAEKYPTGIYFVRLTGDNKTSVYKKIIHIK